MELKNKRYKHFLKFCQDVNVDEATLAKIISSMGVGNSVKFGQKEDDFKTMTLENKQEQRDGMLYTLGLY